TAIGETKVEISERPLGAFSRQLFLGDTLDTDNIKADYDAGVLTLRIPVAEKAKPRKVQITAADSRKEINA
ncbi:Hsp20/alpha crystallin family protein, partial [Catenulispora yoronensis]|uniref:Hsp20/alpha crystallin family protein n=1 Tax=Catenulispora yoronensis TaxID=450799 RepID=UPI0031E4250E